MTIPEEFKRLSVELLGHVSRAIEEDYYRMRLIREASIAAKAPSLAKTL